MKELKEIQFNHNTIVLKDNLVKSAILPKVANELERDIIIQGNTIIEGAIYGRRIEVQNGDVKIQGAVYAQLELHINSDAKGKMICRKSVASADSIVSYANSCRLMFMADLNARQIKLCNSFIAGSIFADEVILTNCVVIGGVFATKNITLNNCILGTFNGPNVTASGEIHFLLPSVFAATKIMADPGTNFYNLTLADLGALYKDDKQMENSGRIKIDINNDELETTLTSEDSRISLLSYTVIGKVLAADLLDTKKLDNHFLITAASLNSQLNNTYNFGTDENGNPKPLTSERIGDFFFDLLTGKKIPQPLSGTFSINEVMERFK